MEAMGDGVDDIGTDVQVVVDFPFNGGTIAVNSKSVDAFGAEEKTSRSISSSSESWARSAADPLAWIGPASKRTAKPMRICDIG